MTYWCQNTITINAPNTEIQQLIAKGIQKDTLNTVCPMPKHIFNADLSSEECIKHTGHPNRHKWAITNWGTKWDFSIYPHERKIFDGGMVFYCETAENPPISAFVNYTRNNPETKVSIEYFQKIIWFKGRVVIANGQILEFNQGEPKEGIDYSNSLETVYVD